MKKKFRITEEQARKIMNMSEATQQSQQTQQSQDPCAVFSSTMVPSSIQAAMSQHGDIDCCRMLNGDFGPVFAGNGFAGAMMLQTHCDVAWSQAVLGYGTFAQGNQLGGINLWADCCDNIDGKFDCHQGSCYASPTGAFANLADCQAGIGTDACPTDDHGPCPNGTVIVGATPQDPNEGNCMECYAGTTAAGPNNAHNPTMAAITGWNCECCKKDGNTNTSSNCEKCHNPTEFRLNGQCTKCVEDPNNPGCCKKDGRSNNGEGCRDESCPHPNQVRTPYPECECECPEGAGEKGCNTQPYGNWNKEECCCADQKGNCDPNSVVGPDLQSKKLAPAETKDQKELREQVKRIKELLK